jgi:predicted nucleic acid-binding protein
VIYLDSCALIKLVVPEPESSALLDHLDESTEQLVSCELSRVEVHRALIRIEADEHARSFAEKVLNNVTQLPVTAVVRTACTLPGQHLRSLDALHLAAALQVPVSEFISYDKRLCAAAQEAGLAVAAPA